MQHRRVLVYTAESAVSPTFQIRIAAPLQIFGIEVVNVDDLKPKELIDVVRSEVDAVIVHRDMRKQCGTYEPLREAARIFDKPLIYDVDDLLIHVSHTHPDYSTYQSRAMRALKLLVDADLVVASTPVLGDYLRLFHPHVLAIPNILPQQHWRDTFKNDSRLEARGRVKNKTPATITIGYIGTETHLPDLELIEGALVTVLDKFGGRVRFVAVGMSLPSAIASHPAATQLTLPRAVRKNYSEFANFAAELPIAIGIAPLVDTPFNRCKSDIKFQEYAALGIPGVFSNLPPYSDAVIHACNGYLAGDERDWVEMLGRLISSAQIRQNVATSAMEGLRRRWQSRTVAWNRALGQACHIVQMTARGTKQDFVSAVIDDLFVYQNDIERQLQKTVSYQLTKTFRKMRRHVA